ncbi:YaiI/YqxD family protein [Sedimentibacter sp.]|uniref:YaiI/YqxD family protein n=1 Tax=Sedimentibacter sp. TaxID=1960295 RepID=UPI0028B194D3|nr:YaiI/YqxD family protein [Sedimentibacter sp.]
MRIIIDGDACPQRVKEICEQAAKEFKIELIIVVDIDHYIVSDFEVIVVEQGRDSVDYKIVQIFREGDILITQDYGLASLVLSKASAIIHTSGFFINKNNIDNLLQSRYISERIRKQGGKTKGPSKRTKEQDENFKKCLYKVLHEKFGKSSRRTIKKP